MATRALDQVAVRVATLVLAVALAFAFRASTAPQVFTPEGTRFLADEDPLYHVLRARRILEGSPDGWWFDRNLDFPSGAQIVWPPGWDLVIAGAARVVDGPAATPAQVERVAAWVPLVAGVAAVAALWWAATAWLGVVAGAVAALLAAVLPLQVEWGALGRPDHHIMEMLLLTLTVLAFERASTARDARWRGWAAALAVTLAAAQWVWQGATLHVVVVVLATVVLQLVPGVGAARRGATRALAVGSAAAAILLAGTLAVAHPPGALAPTALRGVTIFQPALLLAVAAWAGSLDLASRRRPDAGTAWRAGAAVAAGIVPLGVLLVLFHGPVEHGWRTLAVTDALWKTIAEDQPLLFGPYRTRQAELDTIAVLFGPVLLAPLAAIPAIRRRWREAPEVRAPLAVLLLWTILFLALASHSIRFRYYLGAPVVVLAALSVDDVRERVRRRGHARVGWLAALALTAVYAAPALARPTPVLARLDPGTVGIMDWVREQNAARDAVLAPWDLGHSVQYYAGAPAIATPFGSDLGDDGLRDLAQFYDAAEEDQALDVVRRRRVRFMLLNDPLPSVIALAPYAPPGTPALAALGPVVDGRLSVRRLDGYERAAGARLFAHDGSADAGDGVALRHFRLVGETPALKVFEVVPGAELRIHGARPGALLTASVGVVTNLGRALDWWTSARADADGRAIVVVPFATGMNRAVLGAVCRIRAGDLARDVAIPDAAVTDGAVIPVALAPGG